MGPKYSQVRPWWHLSSYTPKKCHYWQAALYSKTHQVTLKRCHCRRSESKMKQTRTFDEIGEHRASADQNASWHEQDLSLTEDGHIGLGC